MSIIWTSGIVMKASWLTFNVWISGDDNQAAFTIVCLRFVLDCYGSLSHIFDRDHVVEAKRK